MGTHQMKRSTHLLDGGTTSSQGYKGLGPPARVIHKVTWPHEVVYTSEGKPASYQELTIPLFVQGFLIVMEIEEGPVKQLMSTHLQDLMSDAQWYGWDKVRTFQWSGSIKLNRGAEAEDNLSSFGPWSGIQFLPPSLHPP